MSDIAHENTFQIFIISPSTHISSDHNTTQRSYHSLLLTRIFYCEIVFSGAPHIWLQRLVRLYVHHFPVHKSVPMRSFWFTETSRALFWSNNVNKRDVTTRCSYPLLSCFFLLEFHPHYHLASGVDVSCNFVVTSQLFFSFLLSLSLFCFRYVLFQPHYHLASSIDVSGNFVVTSQLFFSFLFSLSLFLFLSSFVSSF